jgi:hypothetical protein
MMVEQAMPVLLRAITRRTPAEENHPIGSMSDGLVCPQAQLSRARTRAESFPTARTRLLFHNPKLLLYQATHGIMTESQTSCVVPGKFFMPETKRVIIPTDVIQRPGKLKVIQSFITKSHEIIRDEMMRACFP